MDHICYQIYLIEYPLTDQNHPPSSYCRRRKRINSIITINFYAYSDILSAFEKYVQIFAQNKRDFVK